MKAVTIFAPATVANVGCGFDVMGFAFEGIGDIVRMRLLEGEDAIKYINLSGVDLPEDIEMNIMTPAIRAIREASGVNRAVEVKILQKIIPGSGIGSSAAAVSAAVYGYNALIGFPFNDEELINFALEGETLASGAKHADNVAPCLMGGVVLIRDYNPLDLVSIEVVDGRFYVAVVHPHFVVRTKEARQLLKPQMELPLAIRQWANVGAMVAGMLQGDADLVGRSLVDNVAEQARKGFIPDYDLLKTNIIGAGAMGANISGSGPSVFALCKTLDDAKRVNKIMDEHFTSRGIECDIYASPISKKGCVVL